MRIESLIQFPAEFLFLFFLCGEVFFQCADGCAKFRGFLIGILSVLNRFLDCRKDSGCFRRCLIALLCGRFPILERQISDRFELCLTLYKIGLIFLLLCDIAFSSSL